MKKIATLLAVLLIISTAVAALKQPIIEKLLALKAKEFITPEFITKVTERHKYVYERGLDFNGLYHDVRDEAYEATFVKDMRTVGGNYDDYYGYRTVAVSVFRSQLHKNNTLEEVYHQVRHSFIKAVKKSKPDERTGLIKLLTRGSEAFAVVEKDSSRAKLVKELNVPQVTDYEFGEHCNKVLSKRLSPEQTVKAIGQPAPQVSWFLTPEAIDPDGLKRFALRRFDEGGQKLVRKYQTVIALMLTDAKAADAAADIEKEL